MTHFNRFIVFIVILISIPAASHSQALLSISSLNASSSPESSAYADGVRAINESRWKDAVDIFNRIADSKSNYSDGALYWKAYALNKSGNITDALDSCSTLHREYVASRWIEECDALEIQIGNKKNQPIPSNALKNEDDQLLALNSLMNENKKQAAEQIDELLNSDAPPATKKDALFVLESHHMTAVDDQNVRIRSVDGDVRIHHDGEEKKDQIWQQAVANLDLQAGDSIVTQDGRCEIEFEDASIAYLDKNSVLVLSRAETVNGSPRTELSLLTGTASLHLHPQFTNSGYAIHTPTDNLGLRAPNSLDIRLSSYSDGIAVAKLNTQTAKPEKPNYYHNGQIFQPTAPEDETQHSEFDAWANERYSARIESMNAAQQSSGLNTPVAGLDQLAAAGTFFDCQPYGRCWEPSDAAITAVSANAIKNASPQTAVAQTYIAFFPCSPFAFQYYWAVNAQDSALYFSPWSWGACHSGYWIYHKHHHRYVWVASAARHHSAPYQWVRSGHTVAIVPKPPMVKGSPITVSKSDPVLIVKGKNNALPGPGLLDEKESLSLLKEPPREFRHTDMPKLASKPEPQMFSRAIKANASNHTLTSTDNHTAIKFDAKSGAFMQQKGGALNSTSKPSFAPLGNHVGSTQSHNTASSVGSSASHASSSASAHSSSSSSSSSSHSTSSTSSSSSGSHH